MKIHEFFIATMGNKEFNNYPQLRLSKYLSMKKWDLPAQLLSV
jgi:hypothetical protein